MSKIDEQVGAVVAEVVASQVAGKKWYVSKTVWANVVAGLALSVQLKYGFIVGPELQALLITAANLILRKLTKEEIVW